MILVLGSDDDPPAALIASLLQERGEDVLRIDDSALAALRHEVVVDSGVAGWIETLGRRVEVADIRGIYLRPGDALPEGAYPAMTTLLAVAARLPGVVVNRPTAGRSNWSKPLQARLVQAAGFDVPETLVTTDAAAARAFLAAHGRIVYKSISGIRSIVASLGPEEAERLEDVASGPVQLQRWIAGTDVRVHVVGERWFATEVVSAADDYRYAALDGAEAVLAAVAIPDALGRRLVRLTAGMGLLLSGVDLRRTAADEYYCFEVNPSPGFTFYEEATGQPIGAAVADLLLGG